MNNKIFHITEYGTIRSKKDYPLRNYQQSINEIYLPNKQFEDLFEFVLQNQEYGKEAYKAFSIFSKGRKKQIKVKNYVGVVETSTGLHLEILPKIFHDINSYREEKMKTKKTFVRMLCALKNSPFIKLDTAHLSTEKDIPILEVFIRSYINEVEKLILTGLKSQYKTIEENYPGVKGRVNLAVNIRLNYYNQARHYCSSDTYSKNIPLNRIVKTTLDKLHKYTKNYNNLTAIKSALALFEDVDNSTNIFSDLIKTEKLNRLYSNYATVIELSRVFLTNKSFLNFKGDANNIAILFPMERIFEDYIARLFKKHIIGLKVQTQDQSYFLVEKHKGKSKFRLKPDIVISDENKIHKYLIDTKWKLIDATRNYSNYKITQADMYQLYAYGRKYSKISKLKLALIYPANANFHKKLDSFVYDYDDDLTLDVIPFNFEIPEKQAIDNILQEIDDANNRA
jgi:5-methylcytosine-specific restriction enzyme subunit McrC